MLEESVIMYRLRKFSESLQLAVCQSKQETSEQMNQWADEFSFFLSFLNENNYCTYFPAEK